MNDDFSRILPYVVAGLVVLLVYRRLRRSFGRQLLRPTRMKVRLGLLLVVGISVLPTALRSGAFLAAVVLGACLGGVLGLWGARHTRFLKREERLYYVPHTYSGIAVSLLFVGRLIYRLVVVYSAARAAGPGARFDPRSTSMLQSPLTVGMVLVLVGYYVTYYVWILKRSKHISPEDLEADSAPIAVV